MRQYRTYSIAQAYAYTPSKDILQRLQTPMTARRVSKFVSFVLGLGLGAGHGQECHIFDDQAQVRHWTGRQR